MRKKATSLIIPCYWTDSESEFMTIRCLKSVHDNHNKIYKIIVNDGSPRNGKSADLYQQYTDLIDLRIDLPENLGYCQAVNAALEAAQGDVIIVGNNDLEFPPKWLTQLVKPLDAYDIVTCWTSDQNDIVKQKSIEEDAKFGSLFAMKRTVYDTIGGFDPQFRGYFGDLDYRRRALDAGFKIGKNLNLVVKHQAKATYNKTDPNDKEYKKAMVLYEAKWGYLE